MRGVTYEEKYLMMLWNKMEYFKAHYVNPSQETFLKWLIHPGTMDISRRTLNRHLRNLQKRQILRRIRRIKHSPQGGMVFATTLYSLAYLGLVKLKMLGVITQEQLQKYVKNSQPFKSRMRKKQYKFKTQYDSGYHSGSLSLGDLLKTPG